MYWLCRCLGAPLCESAFLPLALPANLASCGPIVRPGKRGEDAQRLHSAKCSRGTGSGVELVEGLPKVGSDF